MGVGTQAPLYEESHQQSVFQWKLPKGPSAEALLVMMTITIKRRQRVRKNMEDHRKTDSCRQGMTPATCSSRGSIWGMCGDGASSANPGSFRMDLKSGFVKVPPVGSQQATAEGE